MARKTTYRQKYHLPWVRSLARRGLTVEEIAGEVGVSKSTLYRWCAADGELWDALNAGRDYADSLVEDSLYRRAMGMTATEVRKRTTVNPVTGQSETAAVEQVTKEVPPDIAACIFWLKNRAPQSWSDNPRPRDAEGGPQPTYRMNPLDLAAPFVGPYRAIWGTLEGEGSLREVVLKGGRGGGKSVFIAHLVYEVMMRLPEANVVFLRRYRADLRPTVFQQFCRIVADEGPEGWNITTSPMRCERADTGTCVYFFGADNPVQAKSFAPERGHVALLVIEECDELKGLEHVSEAELTYLRSNGSGARQLSVLSFNPQPSRQNWMNQYVAEVGGEEQVLISESTYLDLPEKWLGERFLAQAEWLRVHRPEEYRNRLLGEVTGTGGELFGNVVEHEITDEVAEGFEVAGLVRQGVDWGYEHPNVFVRVAYDAETDSVYLLHEKYQRHANAVMFQEDLREFRQVETICDSANPDKIADWVDLGWNAYAAVKRWRGGGRAYAWEWLRSRTRIVVDPERTPRLLHELNTLEFERLSDGSYSAAYPDVGEDGVMATIYALNRVITAGKSPIPDYDGE